jgi:tetratricopeptide (TPR) repeat protein
MAQPFFPMSKKSRAGATDKAATSVKASAAISGSPSPGTHAFLARWSTFGAGGMIVLAALAAYYNSFHGPFIFDDRPAITENPTIHHLWSALSPPPKGGALGRPVVNFSLALNYAVSGMQVWGYHAMNLAIHILAGLTLFGIVRRTLLQPVLSHRFGEAARPLAFMVALLWTVHPLQTESVTSIIQRTESLMGLFYLLTLYCFIRGTESSGLGQEAGRQNAETVRPLSSRRSPLVSAFWFLASLFFCVLGMATKEVMVTAPLMVLLYDRTFVAGTFRDTWQRRGGWHLGLFGTWLVLGFLVIKMGGSRETVAGFGLGITPWTYALTQCQAIVLYLRLAVWPHPLVFYYGMDVVQQAATVAPQAIILALLAGGTIIMLWYRPVLGFVGAWFFLILAPSSSVLPLISQTMAEHRMYLPLAAVIALVVLGFYAKFGPRSLFGLVAAAIVLGGLTIQRNNDYRSEVAIWSDTVAKWPGNAWAHNNLGTALGDIPGRLSDAIIEYEAALKINPDLEETHYNLGLVLAKVPGRGPEAMAEFRAALQNNPHCAEAHNNLGSLLQRQGKASAAIAQYKAALQIKPDYAEAHFNLGTTLSSMPGRLPDAILEYEAALKINPELVEAHYNIGNGLFRQGRYPAACKEYEQALALKPDYAEAHANLGLVFGHLGRLTEAVAQFEKALQIKPDFPSARKNLEFARNLLLKNQGKDLSERSAP